MPTAHALHFDTPILETTPKYPAAQLVQAREDVLPMAAPVVVTPNGQGVQELEAG